VAFLATVSLVWAFAQFAVNRLIQNSRNNLLFAFIIITNNSNVSI